MLRGISTPELIIVLVMVIVLFGVGRIARIGKEMGAAVRGFRSELEVGEDEVTLAGTQTEN